MPAGSTASARVMVTPALTLAAAIATGAQAPGTAPAAAAFSTASIVPASAGGADGGQIRLRPRGGVQARNATLSELIAFAHQRHASDRRVVTGGPAWVTMDRFDLEAAGGSHHVMDASGVPGETLRRLRTLLAERFALQVHEEERTQPVYALTLVRADGVIGPKLRRSEIDCRVMTSFAQPPQRAPGLGPPCSTKTPPGRLFANTLPMPALASLLSRHLDRPVVDRTQLSGPFDLELEAREIEAAPGYQPGPSDLALPPAKGPTIFVAVREQLGLELKPVDASVPVLVVDRASRPVP